jgi:flagellar hook-basal body complex protein FliE
MSAVTSITQAPSLVQVGPTPAQDHRSFSDFASHIADVVKQAEVAAVGGMQGKVPMQDVVMKVMEAERTFSAAMAIRDKAVSAYLEISRMQI